MKKLLGIALLLGLGLMASSFSDTGRPVKCCVNLKVVSSAQMKTTEEVTVTYNKSDVCGLKCLGEITMTEKWWFYHNNTLKEKTLTELKTQTAKKGGNVVFVDIKESKGFGVFFETRVRGEVFLK